MGARLHLSDIQPRHQFSALHELRVDFIGFLGQQVRLCGDVHSGWLREAVEFRRSFQRIQLRSELVQVREDVRQLHNFVFVARDLFECCGKFFKPSHLLIDLVVIILHQRLQSGGKFEDINHLALGIEERLYFDQTFPVRHYALW